MTPSGPGTGAGRKCCEVSAVEGQSGPLTERLSPTLKGRFDQPINCGINGQLKTKQ